MIDRITKSLALLHMPTNYPITSFLSFDLVFNKGVTGGLFATDSWAGYGILTSIIIVIALLLAWYTLSCIREKKSIMGQMLVLAGAVSNIIDRLYYGAVIDFIHVFYGSWSFPIFNVADIAIVCGVLIIFIQQWNE